MSQMRWDIEIQIEQFFEEVCFDATRSDSEGKVHEINFFFE
jgi:hypothetical protein